MKVRNILAPMGTLAAIGGASSAFAVDPATALEALGTLGGTATSFGPALFGLAVASSVVVIGIAWIKKGRGAAK